MNIAIITNEYPPFTNMGGIATFMHALAHLLAKMGHRVAVFTDGGNSLHSPATIGRISIIPFVQAHNHPILRFFLSSLLGRALIILFQKYAYSLLQLVRYNVLAYLTFSSYRSQMTPDIIHTPVLFAPGYLLSLFFHKIPIICHAQGPDELLQPFDVVSWDSKLKSRVEAAYMRQSTRVVSCSVTIHTYLQNTHSTLVNRLVYIPNFVDASRSPKLKESVDTDTIIFFGRLENRKGPDLVVQAFAQLSSKYPKLRLMMIGEDVEAWRIANKTVSFSNYVKSMNVPRLTTQRITFIPRIDTRKKLITLLRKHRGIAVLPSRYEPFGYVYIEAMLTGNVTIASSRGAGQEIIEDGSDGFVVAPTVDSIVSCVREIKKLDANHLARIIRRAQEKVRRTYDASCVVDSYVSLYETLGRFRP